MRNLNFGILGSFAANAVHEDASEFGLFVDLWTIWYRVALSP